MWGRSLMLVLEKHYINLLKTQNRSPSAQLPVASIEEDRWAKSVTEQGDLEAFLATAELAGTEFTAEKINVHVAQGPQNEAFISEDRRKCVLHELALFLSVSNVLCSMNVLCLFFI